MTDLKPKIATSSSKEKEKMKQKQKQQQSSSSKIKSAVAAVPSDEVDLVSSERVLLVLVVAPL